jgi:hypothetical protein
MSKKSPIVDIPALSERVKEISKTYKAPNKPKERNRDGSENLLRGIVGGLVINAIAQDPDYWKRADIRMVPASEFEDCLSKVRKMQRSSAKESSENSLVSDQIVVLRDYLLA